MKALPIFFLAVVTFVHGLKYVAAVQGASLGVSQADVHRGLPGPGLRLPELGGRDENIRTAAEGQSQGEDTWGRWLATGFAGLLLEADERLNGNHGEGILSAVGRSRRASRPRRVARTRKVASRAEQKLGLSGRARVSLSVDKETNYRWGIDYSQPVYRTKQHAVLFELGADSENAGRALNVGSVYRLGFGDQALGFGLFVDVDLSEFGQNLRERHIRGGVSAEWKSSGLGISANFYKPLSNWQACDFHPGVYAFGGPLAYLERPAQGADVTLDVALGYMPLWLRARGSFGLDDIDPLTKPMTSSSNATKKEIGKELGLVWRPIPLFQLSAEYRLVSGDRGDVRARAELRFDLGRSFQEQMRSAKTGSTESRRQDLQLGFVHRARSIALAYRDTGLRRVQIPEGAVLAVMCNRRDGCPDLDVEYRPDLVTKLDIGKREGDEGERNCEVVEGDAVATCERIDADDDRLWIVRPTHKKVGSAKIVFKPTLSESEVPPVSFGYTLRKGKPTLDAGEDRVIEFGCRSFSQAATSSVEGPGVPKITYEVMRGDAAVDARGMVTVPRVPENGNIRIEATQQGNDLFEEALDGYNLTVEKKFRVKVY